MEIYDSIHLPELESSKTKIIMECLAHSRLLVKIRGSFGWLEIVLKTEWSGHGAPSIWEDEAEEWQSGLYRETCFKRNKKTEWLVSDFRYRVEILVSWVTRVLLKGPWSSGISLSS